MKKRLLAVVLAVCMIASCCVLFASAASTVAKDKYLVVGKSNFENGSATVGSAKLLSADATIKTVSSPTLSPFSTNGVHHLADTECRDLVQITPVDYKDYISFSGSLDQESMQKGYASVTAILKDYYIIKTLEEIDKTKRFGELTEGKEYQIEHSPSEELFSESGIEVKLVAKLHSVTTGIRISGEKYNNLVSAEIAQVQMDVTRKNGAFGAEGKTQSMVTNVVSDLMPGDEVRLTTSLKDPADEKYYKFNCWVDGNGEIISSSPTIVYSGNTDAAYYAVYVETVNRWRISFSIDDGEGKILVFPEGTHKTKTREVYSSAGGESNIDGQISVLEGKDFKFTLEPAEGYQVGKVIVTDDATGISRNITSLVGLLTGETDWKTLIRATLTETLGTKDKGGTIEPESLGKPSYTFSNVDRDYSIAVTFIKKAALTPDEGKELPSYPAEGLTLMSAEEAVSEAEAAKAARGEGTTVPGEDGAAGAAGGAGASGSVVNPATGSASSSIAVFATLTVAAAAAFVSLKKKEN